MQEGPTRGKGIGGLAEFKPLVPKPRLLYSRLLLYFSVCKPGITIGNDSTTLKVTFVLLGNMISMHRKVTKDNAET